MKKPHREFHLVCTLLIVSVAGTVPAQDWPQWRGPDRDAKAKGFVAPKSWPKELTQKWSVTVGDGVATPALVDGKVYVFSRQEGKETTRCLDAATGKELWQEAYDSLGASGPASSFSGPRSSPAVAEGKVVTMGVRGVLSCLDAATGKLLWRKDDFAGAWPRFFVSSSPLIVNGQCIAQLGGGDRGGIVAYDLATGKENWRWTGDAPAYASPALLSLEGKHYVVAQTDGKVVALELANGKLAWETPFAVQGRGYNAATPVVEGATIVYAGSGRGAIAVKMSKSADGLSAAELWRNPDNSVMYNTPVLKDGALYGLTAGDEFFCINVKDGATAWTAPLKPQAAEVPAQEGGGRRGRGGGRAGYGSIVDAGSVLLALTPASDLIVFQPNPKAYAEIARIKVASSPTYAYPVVSGNRLFIKDQESLSLMTWE